MDEITTPVTTAPSDINPDRAPRFISHAQMRHHHDNHQLTLLSLRERHRMFVRYDGVWWISDPDGYTEITSPAHNARLDRWHERLTNGALWT